MSSTLSFRSATLADVPAVTALVESAYRGEGSRQGWTTEAELLDGQRTDREAVTEIIADPKNRILLAEREGQLLGCCHIKRQGDDGYFGMFAVVPGLQGGGLGRALLQEAERVACEEWKCRRMRMTVIDVRAELIAWYERRGYQRSGEYEPFPYGDERFGIPRRPDLRFEWLNKALG
jgi:ribosomal protein S18 acetylase RimI-like enzyme